MAQPAYLGRAPEDSSGSLSLIERLNWLYYELFITIHLLVLRFTTWVRQRLLMQHKTSATRTVLVIGDGVAEGVGDTMSHGGLAARMEALFRTLAAETQLRLPWHVYTAGRLLSTAADWEAASEMLTGALVSGPHARAEVVALVVGSHDAPDDAQAGTGCVARTAEAAARLGKHVVVCAFPNYEEPRSELFDLGRARRELLVKCLEEAVERLPDGAGTITWAVDIDKVLARRGDVIRVENRFITLNSIGYRAFARELFDEVVLAARKVEWAHWKVKLSGA